MIRILLMCAALTACASPPRPCSVPQPVALRACLDAQRYCDDEMCEESVRLQCIDWAKECRP